MGFRDKMKQMKKDLVRTTQESIERGEDTPDYGSIFFKEKIPQGVPFWRPAFGEHLIDILPFQTAGLDPKYEKGRWVYLIDVWVHMSVGALFDQFVCQVRAHKLPDPMCEYLRAKRLPTDEWKKIAPKRRTAYLIWCHDTPEEEEKGIQIWEVAHWNFEKHLSKISKHPKGGAPIPFSDVADGKTIAFEIVKSGTFTNDQGKEQDSMDFVGHRFVERETEIPDDWDEKSFSLDACIKWKPTWKEQEKAFPLSGEILLAPATPAPATEEKQSDDVPIEDAEAPESPPEETEEEEVEESSENECPGGGTFGEDLEKLVACNKCTVWDACADANDKLKMAQKKKEPKKVEEKPVEKKKIIRRRRRT
jgi:hypothetical protein